MRFDTIEDATYVWVQSFNAFPQDMIQRLMEGDHICEWHEITKLTEGDRVYYEGQEGTISGITDEGYEIELDDGTQVLAEDDSDIERMDYDFLPMWGTMWQFGEGIDDDWLSGEFGTNGLQIMSDLGFRIYEHDEWGYFFGIDGAGYDFYEQHWIPLYKARGLKWHNEEKGDAV